MPLVELSLESLKDFDSGKIAAMVNSALTRVIADVNSRPADKTKRELIIKLTFKPIVDAEGNLESVAIKPFTRTKLPEFHSREIQLTPQRRGGSNVVLFNPHSPDARQGTLLGDDEQE